MLAPGGTLWILEGHAPASPVGRQLTRFMMGRVVPGMTWLFTGSREAKLLTDFYWDTVEQSVRPQTILDTMAEAGFEEIRHHVVSPVCEFIGRKPRSAARAA